jgi:hypothetical protein
LASSVPEASIGGTYIFLKTVSTSQVEVGVERNTSKGNMLGAIPSQKKTLWRRRRPRKIRKKEGKTASQLS